MITTNIVFSSYSPSVPKSSLAVTTASTRRSVMTVCSVVKVFLLLSIFLLLLFSENGGINHHAVVAMTLFDVSDMPTTTTTYYENVPPHSYKEGEIVELQVNKLTSTKDLYPMDYYRLPYCTPVDGVQLHQHNLGQYLSGDLIQNSPYLLKMKTDMYCEQLCIYNLGRDQHPTVPPNKFIKAIRNNYHNNWIVDNLPSASILENDESLHTRYWGGFPVGFINQADQKAYVYNHVNIIIEYHAEEAMINAYRIVRFTVEPFSIAHEIGESVKHPEDFDVLSESYLPVKAIIKNPIPSCNPQMTAKVHTNYDMLVDSGMKAQLASGDVLFTYDVIWKENPKLQWASRWDIYISMNNADPAKVHWLSILYSMIIVVIMSAVLVCKWTATLRRNVPVANPYDYKLLENEDDNETEEVGWVTIRSDVFRPPSFSPMLLAVGCGSGAQLLCTTIVTVWLAYLGYLKAPNRGYFILCQFWFYAIFGIINGYVTARYYKTFGGKEQHRTTTIAAFGLPGIAFTLFMIVECIAILKQSLYAIPFTTIFTLVVLWAGMSVPLVFLGARWGYDQDAIECPIATDSIPREIPKERGYSSSAMTIGVSGLCGIIPMYVCFVELCYIMSSIWMDSYYDGFGYLLIVIFLGSIVIVEQSIYCTYCQLNNEDYHWWWRAFWNGGSVGIFIFLYSIFGYFPLLESASLASFVLYFGYMGLVSLAIFVMMGFVSVLSSLYFNKVLYTSIKAE